jgi:hypothetical protein
MTRASSVNKIITWTPGFLVRAAAMLFSLPDALILRRSQRETDSCASSA